MNLVSVNDDGNFSVVTFMNGVTQEEIMEQFDGEYVAPPENVSPDDLVKNYAYDKSKGFIYKGFAPEDGYKFNVETEAWEIDQELLISEISMKRNMLLFESDKFMLEDYPVVNKDQIKAYRQALRDVTLQENYPFNVEWPDKPF